MSDLKDDTDSWINVVWIYTKSSRNERELARQRDFFTYDYSIDRFWTCFRVKHFQLTPSLQGWLKTHATRLEVICDHVCCHVSNSVTLPASFSNFHWRRTRVKGISWSFIHCPGRCELWWRQPPAFYPSNALSSQQFCWALLPWFTDVVRIGRM